MSKTEKQNNSDIFDYDALPYESACCKYIHPDTLYSVAHEQGLISPKYDTARILDVGCGLGGNLIPYALAFPDTECIGMDLSECQIGEAQKLSRDLRLDNINFLYEDIMNIGQSFGKFDYILCHGVFSWVPDTVRRKILKLCHELLKPNGLAVISYNTLPGWHFDLGLRDAMRFHTRDLDAAHKIAPAREFYDFMAAHSYDDTPFRKAYKTFLQDEAKVLSGLSDNYLYHDQLAPENTAFYLKDFTDMAQEYGLRYVGDAVQGRVTLDNEAESFLAAIDNAIDREQYYDFLTNRRFRLSIVTPAESVSVTANTEAVHIPKTPPQINVSEKPLAWSLARQQILRNKETPMITTAHRESVKTTLLLNLLVLYADGTRNLEGLVTAMTVHVKNGDIKLKTSSGKPIEGHALPETLKAVIKDNLEVMKNAGLLEA